MEREAPAARHGVERRAAGKREALRKIDLNRRAARHWLGGNGRRDHHGPRTGSSEKNSRSRIQCELRRRRRPRCHAGQGSPCIRDRWRVRGRISDRKRKLTGTCNVPFDGGPAVRNATRARLQSTLLSARATSPIRNHDRWRASSRAAPTAHQHHQMAVSHQRYPALPRAPTRGAAGERDLGRQRLSASARDPGSGLQDRT